MMAAQIRWLIRRDLLEVLEIERACFVKAWTEDDLVAALRKPNCIGMVVKENNEIIGYMLYERHRRELHVIRFATHPACQNQGIGRAMFALLLEKLEQQRRDTLRIWIRESNLTGQLVFKSLGFRAIGIRPTYFWGSGTDEAAYEFTYSQPSRSRASEELEGRLVECGAENK